MEMGVHETLARKVLEVVDAGLVYGLGEPTPGKMCVEAAVNYAMGKPHGDEPDCVSPALRQLKIKLNDSRWSSDKARTAGLRRLAIAQLGSAGVLGEQKFARRCATLAIQFAVPFALRAAASVKRNAAHKDKLLAAAFACEREPTRENARAAKAYADADATDAAKRDTFLSEFCEKVVQILIDMKAPGCQWLFLTEAVA